MRAEFQVLVIPFIRIASGTIKYVIFKRADNDCYQFIAGGGEDSESPLEAAMRELEEETNILSQSYDFIALENLALIPASEFEAHKNKEHVSKIPEHCF